VDIKELERRHLSGVPFSAYQYVDVTFGTAGVDTLVTHSLPVSDPEDVRYEVIKADRACRVYDDQSATRRAWGNGYLLLRCDVNDAVVRLRLSLEPQ
jgi:hypothetical protein